MNRDTLLELARWLEDDLPGLLGPRDVFHMGEWSLEHQCGTAACAAGWAIHHEKIPGVRLVRLPPHVAFVPTYRGSSHYRALASALGLTERETIKVFHPDEYEVHHPLDITPADVARRIREVVG